MKKSWSPIIIDGVILLIISTVFVVILDLAFKSLPAAADKSNPLVSEILQTATLGAERTAVPPSLEQTLQKNTSLISLPDEHGDTPLMRTCYVNFDSYASTLKMDDIRLPYVQWLIQKGADVNALDKDGWNALCWASWSGLVNVANTLVANGSKVNIVDKEGNTPLSIAAMRGNPSVVRLLLKSGADKRVKAKNGFDAIDFAKQEFERYNEGFTPDIELDSTGTKKPGFFKKLLGIKPKQEDFKPYFNRRDHIRRLQECIDILSK